MDSTTVNFYLTFRGMPSNMPDLALLFNPSSVLTTRRRPRYIKPLLVAGR